MQRGQGLLGAVRGDRAPGTWGCRDRGGQAAASLDALLQAGLVRHPQGGLGSCWEHVSTGP